MISRRAFTGGAIGAAAGVLLPGRSSAQAAASLAPAFNAIAAYAEANRRFIGFPGLTLGLSLPDGSGRTLNFGVADLASRAPVGPSTLFEIGSISKLINAALLEQLADEGRFALTDRVSALLPDIPLPPGNGIEVQHLLDHVAGLPADAPLHPDGELWTGYAPGEHWHYSNTGYEILGKLAEKAGGKPLEQLLEQRIFRPLGMTRTLGAIRDSDRARYATGYQPAEGIPFVPGEPLSPARWIEDRGAAVNVASTADDMNRLLRSLAEAAQGRGGLGLPPALARSFVTHAVPSDTSGETYGNGIIHLASRGRSYLHHTGGMVGFSSSFHLDPVSGVGAFASANIGYLAEYRPRALTQFAVDALAEALTGRPVPVPPPVGVQLSMPAAYSGRFTGPSGGFEVRASGPRLSLVSGGTSAPLFPVGGDLFRTSHPAFRRFSLLFERRGGTIAAVSWGPLSFLRAGVPGAPPPSNLQLALLAGTYVNPRPWFGTQQVVERGGRLWLGTENPLAKIGDNLWRLGDEAWSPDRVSCADFANDRPATCIWSGEKFARRDG
jgi:D-alanyl-D-alanine carboxypeptidase